MKYLDSLLQFAADVAIAVIFTLDEAYHHRKVR